MEEKIPLRKRLFVKIIVVIICLLIALVMWLAFYVNGKMDRINFVPDEETITIDQNALLEADSDATNSPDGVINAADQGVNNNVFGENGLYQRDDVKNILIVGSDRRSVEERGRSDSMILVSINETSKKIVATSILRDIYVSIPGVENNNRINAAYSFGGAQLMLKTIEQNFGFVVDQYFVIDFSSFVDIIDSLGGVAPALSEEEIQVALKSGGKRENNTVVMTGEQALSYARNRSDGHVDFSRTQRQRTILEAVFNKAKTLSVTEINDLMNQFLPQVTTNFTKNELFSLLLNVMDYIKYDFDSWSIPVEGTYTNLTVRKMQVLSIDFKKNIDLFLERVYDVEASNVETNNTEPSNTEIPNAETDGAKQ